MPKRGSVAKWWCARLTSYMRLWVSFPALKTKPSWLSNCFPVRAPCSAWPPTTAGAPHPDLSALGAVGLALAWRLFCTGRIWRQLCRGECWALLKLAGLATFECGKASPTLRRAVDIPMWERLPYIQNADIAVAGSFFHTTPGVLFAGFPEVS